jgi:AraC-like DNA-binding protein
MSLPSESNRMPNPPRGAPSTIASWTATLVRALDAQGIDGPQLARLAGIDPEGLHEPDARVPREALTRLWHLAVEATGDPCFGLSAARFVTQTTFHALGYAVLASATIKDAFERIVRYRRLIGDVLELSLVDAGDRYRFVIDVATPPGVPHEAIDTVAAVTVRQARVLSGRPDFQPLAVRLKRPAPPDIEPFARTFRAPVLFGEPENVIEYARADLEEHLPSANAELARQNDEVVLRYLARLESGRISKRVQHALLDALPGGPPSKHAVARALGMSPRTLQRQLTAEGTSFKDLLSEARVRLARSYVEEGRLSVTEIAFVLGFADTSTFSRAFKRWTGLSPRGHARRRRSEW